MKFFARFDWSSSFWGGIPKSSMIQDSWSPATQQYSLLTLPSKSVLTLVLPRQERVAGQQLAQDTACSGDSTVIIQYKLLIINHQHIAFPYLRQWVQHFSGKTHQRSGNIALGFGLSRADSNQHIPEPSCAWSGPRWGYVIRLWCYTELSGRNAASSTPHCWPGRRNRFTGLMVHKDGGTITKLTISTQWLPAWTVSVQEIVFKCFTGSSDTDLMTTCRWASRTWHRGWPPGPGRTCSGCRCRHAGARNSSIRNQWPETVRGEEGAGRRTD